MKINPNMSTLIEPKVKAKRSQLVAPERALLLFNDEVNTFDHVISCLVTICGHDALQAEQCAWIVHTAGKCAVHSGSLDVLQPMCLRLLHQGLSAKIVD
ncbi:MAG: ATP-dependent Clp protease adaptor protein ClpS [Bacteroidota bacterium]|jgi:ATP-dependent Clp protease adaptor protein ClpS